MTCAVCGLAVFLPDVPTHPCCVFAAARGESCGGCRAFGQRDAGR